MPLRGASDLLRSGARRGVHRGALRYSFLRRLIRIVCLFVSIEQQKKKKKNTGRQFLIVKTTSCIL